MSEPNGGSGRGAGDRMEGRSWWFGSGVGSETGYFTVTLLITDTLQVVFMTLADG